MADCYAAGDRAFMQQTQQLRARLLGPLLNAMSSLGIQANHITMLSLFVGLAFVPLWMLGQPIWAVLALLGHVVLDGLDGPLARHARAAGPRGSFTDTATDHLVVVASALALMATGDLGPVVGGLYLVAYSLVLAFSMVRNAMGVPYTWLVRPRFFVFAAIGLVAAGPLLPTASVAGWILYGVVGGSALLLSLKAATGFLAIRRALV